jgi:16S rRNA (guanine(527)-N(7))-methyltransferase RsmG
MKANKQESANQQSEFKIALENALQDFQVQPLDDEQIAKLVGHYALMTQWNRHTNLTRITEPVEAARLHYAESIFGAQFLGDARKALDIGSGAGFPAFPLAVTSPKVEITALESNQKKSLFLCEAKDALQVANFKIVSVRIEDFDFQAYELLTSRALDRAEEVMPKVLKKMHRQQRLMLYCAPEMIEHLQKHLAEDFRVETHKIPQTAARLIAIFSRA